MAAQSLFVALLVFAANYRKIREFRRSSATTPGPGRKRPSRRAGKPISEWTALPTSEPRNTGPPSSA